MNFTINFVTFVIVTCIAITQIACQKPQPHSPPPPTVPSEKLYSYLQDEKNKNPTRLNELVKLEPDFRVILTVTKIEGSRIQQHFEIQDFAPDLYIECDFSDKCSMLSIDVGDQVTVEGKLHEVFKRLYLVWDSAAVKLKECSLLQGNSTQKRPRPKLDDRLGLLWPRLAPVH